MFVINFNPVARSNPNVIYVASGEGVQRPDLSIGDGVYRSSDGGKTWTPIQNNLPARGTVYTVAEDNVNTDLLFAGTEFGVYFSIDGGAKWTQLKGGLPTITVKDMQIQKRESDLVIATFGRGYYVLDDYSPLRNLKKEDLQKTAFISPIKKSKRAS